MHKALFLIAVLTIPITLQYAYAQTLSFQTIDVSGTLNPNSFPYGIDCSDATYVYITLFQQGLLARINKATGIAEILPDNNAVVAGDDFYATVGDGAGNQFVNERDKGSIWKLATGTNTWIQIPIVEELAHATLDYPNTYATDPNTIRIAEGAPHGLHTYQMNVPSAGGIVFANGFIWVTLSYNLDFDAFANALGVADASFSGVVRINPTTNAVTRFAIAGAGFLASLDQDSIDPTQLWVTDKSGDRLYRFNTNTNAVAQTIVLPAGSSANDVVTNLTHIFIALNKPAGGNSEILQIDRLALTQTTIDTTATNTGTGTFTVFIMDSFLIWTDQSGHVGAVNLLLNSKTVQTTTSNSNHFGCQVGKEFWFAGQGSAIVGKFDPVGTSGGSGGGCKGTWINSKTKADMPSNIGWSSCLRLDDTPPTLKRAYVAGEYVCIEAQDNVGSKKVTFNGKEIPKWVGSYNHFCTTEKLPPLIEIVVEDLAGNTSKSYQLDALTLTTTKQEQTFNAIVAKELNPHKQIEGITLETKEPMKQIRLAHDPMFEPRFLQLSDKAFRELDGKATIIVKYLGAYDVEKKGQLHVFATNKGHLTTFDVTIVNNDFHLTPVEEKPYQYYDLNTVNIKWDKLNALQAYELKQAFTKYEDQLSIVQKQVLSKVSRSL